MSPFSRDTLVYSCLLATTSAREDTRVIFKSQDSPEYRAYILKRAPTFNGRGGTLQWVLLCTSEAYILLHMIEAFGALVQQERKDAEDLFKAGYGYQIDLAKQHQLDSSKVDLAKRRQLESSKVELARKRRQAPATNFFLKLPDESLLQVVQYLERKDLLNVQKTCRHLNMLTQDHTLNAMFFRPSNRNIPTFNLNARTLEVHPIFKWMNPYKASIDDVFYQNIGPENKGRVKMERLAESVYLHDMATNPPVTKIRFRIHNFPTTFVQRKKGVTVGQLVTGICKVLGKPNRSGIPKMSNGVIDLTVMASNLETMNDYTPPFRGFPGKHKTRNGNTLVLKTRY